MWDHTAWSHCLGCCICIINFCTLHTSSCRCKFCLWLAPSHNFPYYSILQTRCILTTVILLVPGFLYYNVFCYVYQEDIIYFEMLFIPPGSLGLVPDDNEGSLVSDGDSTTYKWVTVRFLYYSFSFRQQRDNVSIICRLVHEIDTCSHKYIIAIWQK